MARSPFESIAMLLLEGAGPQATLQTPSKLVAGDDARQAIFSIASATRDTTRLLSKLPAPIAVYTAPRVNPSAERVAIIARGACGIVVRHVAESFEGDRSDATVFVKALLVGAGRRDVLRALRAELQTRAATDVVHLLLTLDPQDLGAVLPQVVGRLAHRFTLAERAALATSLAAASWGEPTFR